MNFKSIPTIIAVALGLLIAYALYNFQIGDNKLLLSAGTFLLLTITSTMAFGVTFELPRTTTNIRFVSWTFFIIGLISNTIFTFVKFAAHSYVLVTGILLLLFVLIVYSISKVKQ